MKKLHLITVLVFLFAFSFTILAQQIETGTFSANSSTPNYTLDKNSGDRTITLEINYPTAFDKKPEVILSVNQLDAATSSNIRYEIKTISVSRDNFIIQIKTWSESKIFGISGTWLAISK
ncbi:MAG: H-type lectin domain-containing protein [Ignavibacteriaceae bacterium]